MSFFFRPLRRAAACGMLLALAGSASTQTYQPINAETDPANLAGERVSAPSLADDLPINHGAAALQQLLLKLRTRASLMLIVAHPDDEDGGLLTYESRGQGARVAMLTLTRGEGGQNLMSADFDDALGLIRTQELLAADRYMGVDQMFGTVVDFGFSKTREETLRKWGHDRVLYDAVRAVRLYRPLVIASVFVGGPTDGHGHHQVAGEIAQEVFLAAGDPKVFPEMGLAPWQPLKVYARVPFSRVTSEGMYDYATGRTLPTRFHNYVTRTDTHTAPVATVTIPEGDKPKTPAFNGMSYVQFARQGLALQKSQIGANVRLAPDGAFDVGYTLMGSCVPGHELGWPNHPGFPAKSNEVRSRSAGTTEKTLFDDVDTSTPGIATLAPEAMGAYKVVLTTNLQGIESNVAEAQARFDPAHLDRAADPLRTALVILDSLIKDLQQPGKWKLTGEHSSNLLHELRVKRVQLNDALVLALGVTLETMTKPQHEAYVDPLKTSDRAVYTNARISNQGVAPVTIKQLLANADQRVSSEPAKQLLPGASVFAESMLPYRKPPVATRPYFSRPDKEQPYYGISDPALRNAPMTPAPLVALAKLDYLGTELDLEATTLDPEVAFELRAQPSGAEGSRLPRLVPQAAGLIPPVSVKLGRAGGVPPYTSQSDLAQYQAFSASSAAGMIPVGSSNLPLGVLLGVQAFEPSILGPARITPEKIRVALHVPPGWMVSPATYNSRMEPVLEHFTVTTGPLEPGKTYKVTSTALFEGRSYAESFRPVGYPGLTYTNSYTPATYRVKAVDVTTAPERRIGYLPGTGDNVASFLPDLGISPTLLLPADLTPESLKRFDTLVLGVRAFNAHPDLDAKALLDFARNGGVVIAQYNTGDLPSGALPYPLSVPGDPAHNVVVEENPVKVVEPNAPILTWPNKITARDFDGWIEERGHGFAATFDPHWDAPLEMHDPDQDPQRSGLLVAPVGKGAYIYCPLALYRQLPEGVPGAYRLMANLLSYAKNPRREAGRP